MKCEGYIILHVTIEVVGGEIFVFAVQKSSKEIIGIILEIGFFPCEPSISTEFSEDMRPVVRLDLDEIPVITHSV